MKDFKKLYQKVLKKDLAVSPASAAINPGATPTKKQIYQSRKNFGVNFGGLFVLEKYIFDSFFIDNTGAELEAITAQVKANGIKKTRELLENHWKGYASDQDWQWLKEVGVNSIRLPVGYWAVGGGRFASGTAFSKISEVYANAWEIYKTYIEKAGQYNISVLVDLHALPGGANTGDHSGQVLKEAGFWDSLSYRHLTLEVVGFLAQDLSHYENVAGLQIVNESVSAAPGGSQSKYYRSALSEVRKSDREVPVIISDGWDPQPWANWIGDLESSSGGVLGLTLDVHIYRTFSDEDRNKDPDTIIGELDRTVVNGIGNTDMIVGEFSGVLDGNTWGKFHGDRDAKVREFLNKQIQLFNQRTSGWYFWTFRFGWGDGGEWGFVPMVNKGGIPRRPTSVNNFPNVEKREELKNQKLQDHSNYWNGTSPKEHFEHERFAEGFLVGWNDTAEFAKLDGSTIGRKHAWSAARKQEHINSKGNSKYVWEWDHGFAAGAEAFEEAAGLKY